MGILMVCIGVALLLLTIPIATTFIELFNKKRNIIVGIICCLAIVSGLCLIIFGMSNYSNTLEKYKIINAVCYTSENNDNLYKIEFVNQNNKYMTIYLADEEYELYVQGDTFTITNADYNKLKAVGF